MKKNHKVAEHIKLIDNQLEVLLFDLGNYDSYSEEYTSAVKNIQILVDMRDDLLTSQNTNKFKGIDINTIVSGALGLTQILLILNYEKSDIVTSKAMTIANKWLGK